MQCAKAAGAHAVRVDAYETRPGATSEQCAAERQMLSEGSIQAIAFTSTAEVIQALSRLPCVSLACSSACFFADSTAGPPTIASSVTYFHVYVLQCSANDEYYFGAGRGPAADYGRQGVAASCGSAVGHFAGSAWAIHCSRWLICFIDPTCTSFAQIRSVVIQNDIAHTC